MYATIDFSISDVLIRENIIACNSGTIHPTITPDLTVTKVKQFENKYGKIPSGIREVIMTELAARQERNELLLSYAMNISLGKVYIPQQS